MREGVIFMGMGIFCALIGGNPDAYIFGGFLLIVGLLVMMKGKKA